MLAPKRFASRTAAPPVPSPSPGSRIKGAAFRQFLLWYDAHYGDGRLVAAGESLSQDLQESLSLRMEALGILSGAWYSPALVHAILDSLLEGRSQRERREMAQQAAWAIMEVNLRGVYRLLFRCMATPRRYARYGHKLWQMHYESGTYTVTMPDDRTAVTRVRDWTAHHPFICDLHREAAIPIYRGMGLEGVKNRRQACVSDGDSECSFLTRWS